MHNRTHFPERDFDGRRIEHVALDDLVAGSFRQIQAAPLQIV
jgi:hypothetical protein